MPYYFARQIIRQGHEFYENNGKENGDKARYPVGHKQNPIRPLSRTSNVRSKSLGQNAELWGLFCDVFDVAFPVIEQQFFDPEEINPPGNNVQPTTAMALKDTVLLKDLERLNDLLLIIRNVLASTKLAQNLCGDKGFDQHIMKFIDLCVRVTARQYEGEEPGNRTESQLALLNASCKWIPADWRPIVIELTGLT